MMAFDLLSIGWFDMATLLLVLLGINLGKRRGVSRELFEVLQWGLIIGLGALSYRMIGELISVASGFKTLTGYMIAYLLVTLIIAFAFRCFKEKAAERLEARHAFGNGEYYLGMLAGGIRFTFILIFVMALLHPHGNIYTEARQTKAQVENFGAVFFPTLGTIRQDVFKKSFSGRWADSTLEPVFIVPPVQNQASR